MSTRSITRTVAVVAATLAAAAASASCAEDSSSADASTSAPSTSTVTTSSRTRTISTPATSTDTGTAVGGPTSGTGGGDTGGGNPGGGGGTGGDPGGGGSGDPVDERCSVNALQQAYGGTLTQVGSVAYCDGDWAVSGNAPGYLNQPFMHRDHGWVVFTADASNPGTGHECYTTAYLDQIGAPEVVRGNLTVCMEVPEPTETPAPAS